MTVTGLLHEGETMTSEESTPRGPDDVEDQHDPDGDPDMMTEDAGTQPDQAEGEDDPAEAQNDADGADR